MHDLARHFVNRFQGGFPLEERPYASVASALDTDETTLIAVIGQLLEQGVLSRFGPLFDASAMGGSLTLAALAVPDNRFDQVAGMVNDLPEVAHNYHRDHALNMWFVIATETPQQLSSTIQRIESLSGLPVYNFPKLQTFYLGLWLWLDEDGEINTRPIEQTPARASMRLDDLDRALIRATQSGLPLQPTPYRDIARTSGCRPQQAMQRLQAMLDGGVIRRIGAVPNHYRLGLRANGMSVWDIDEVELPHLGARVGALDFVSHCYARPRRLPLWPYNLFAMVHGRNRDEVERKVERIAVLLGKDCRRHDVLLSTRILKKTGLRLVA